MARKKVAISIDSGALKKVDDLVYRAVFPSRSQAIETAVREKLARIERGRLARECSKLDPVAEKAMAEEGLAEDVSKWPEY